LLVSPKANFPAKTDKKSKQRGDSDQCEQNKFGLREYPHPADFICLLGE
jgi:hypothetical protein